MFFLRHIWKQARLWPIFVASLLSLTMTAAPVLAAGESYAWKSSSDASSFTGADGVYTSAVTFSRVSNDASGATYVGSATYQCPLEDTTRTDQIKVSLDATQYNKGAPLNGALGNLSGGNACAAFGAPSIVYPNSDSVTGAATGTGDTPSCDQGSLTWLFCPVIDNLSGAASKIATSILPYFLKVNTITPATTPALYQVWTHMRDLADVLFILVFFAIIASTMMEQDIAGLSPYTIRTIWIRLVVAAVLVQFSFLISGFIVDIGNVLGGGIGDLIGYLANASKGPASMTNFLENLGTASLVGAGVVGATILVTWEIALPILAGIVISLLVAFLTLGARFLLIAILIAISPLACVAWVLPNTRRFMGDWAKLLLRLVLMYPIIIGIFSLAGVVNEILPFASSTSSSGIGSAAVIILKPLIAIAAFLAIPASFKLAGKGLERAYGFLNGAGSAGKGWLKGSQMYKTGQDKRKERQASFMQQLSTDPAVTAFTRSDSKLKRAAGGGFLTASSLVLAGAPRGGKAVQKSYNAAQTERAKTLKEFENISPGLIGDAILAAYGDKSKMAKITREAPALLEYTKTLAGRSALVGRANEFNIFGDEHERAILNSRYKNEFTTLQTSLGKNQYKEMPHIQRVNAEGIARDDFAETVKSYTAGFVQSTVNKSAIEAAIGRKETDPNGKVHYIPDDRSLSFAKGWAQMESAQVGAMFAVGRDGRNRNSADKRSAFAQMVGNNLAVWKQTDKGRNTIGELMSAVDEQRNADIFKDFYLNIMHEPKSSVDALNPETDATHYALMRDEIKRFLS